MSLSFRSSKRGRDVIDVWETAAAHIDWPRAICGRRAGLLHCDEPPPQRLVHEFFERLVEGVSQLLNTSSDIVVKRKRGPHASKHNRHDVNLSFEVKMVPRTKYGVSAQAAYLSCLDSVPGTVFFRRKKKCTITGAKPLDRTIHRFVT